METDTREPIKSEPCTSSTIELEPAVLSTPASTSHDGTSGPDPQPATAPYTILSERRKKFLILVASFAAAISPFSTSTYYPSVVTLAQDLHVSVSKINLTISTYQIFQGVAPTFVAAFADSYGRRPAFLICFVIYFFANLGLALQDDYAALLVLRCLQSSGSSGTTALAQAVVTDIATRAERGRYLAYGIIGATAGPTLGPVVGGLLTQYLGWRAIFWFLLILGSSLFLIILFFFPETARCVVGNGSMAPQPWNRPVLELLGSQKSKSEREAHPETVEARRTGMNPLTSLTLLAEKEFCILCMAGGLIFAGYSAVTSNFASELERRFHYDSVQSGLCYLPIAFGSLTAGVTTSRLVDWKFRREAAKQGLEIVKNKQQDITSFDTEKARLAFTFPMVCLACCLIVAYGWQMQYRAPLATILVTMFFLANQLTSILITNMALLTDLNRLNAAAVGAATNLTRCILSAGGIAAVAPLTEVIGIGWVSTVTAAVWLVAMAAFFLVYLRGFSWRKGKGSSVA